MAKFKSTFSEFEELRKQEHDKGQCKEEIEMRHDMWVYVCKPCGAVRALTIADKGKEGIPW